ncbi:MAG: type II secretion system protein [Candidatus Acidiferrales bacterium]
MRTLTNKLRIRTPGWLRKSRGFTLLELMIVVSIIVILATLAAGRYQRSLELARQAAQKKDLAVMNNAIQQYTEDKGQSPNSLDDLKTAGYIGEIPVDPVTHRQDWATDPCDELFSADQTSSEGICDVHAGNDQGSSTDNQDEGSD